MCIRKESTLNREIMLTLHKNGLHKHLKQVCFSNRSGNMHMRFCTERTAAFKRVSSDISVYFLAWGPECHPQLSEKQPLKQTLLGNPQTELEEHQIHSSAQRKRLISTRFQTRHEKVSRADISSFSGNISVYLQITSPKNEIVSSFMNPKLCFSLHCGTHRTTTFKRFIIRWWHDDKLSSLGKVRN